MMISRQQLNKMNNVQDNDDSFKTKKEKNRINYYINKLNEFERLLNDRSAYNYTCIYITSCILV